MQVVLSLKGNLPDPCHQLRVAVNQAYNQNRIANEVYSVADANQICIQMLEPFETSIQLWGFPAGHYTVWVNGEKVGEFDS